MNEKYQYLEYYVPKLGRKVNTILFSNALKCYNFLENHGHIDRMKRIDQLGVISRVYKGAYHSRWEYAMVHLHLIHQLYVEKAGLGLNSQVNIDEDDISGAEVLQIWVLLFNSGHLPGTFASERALLRNLRRDNDIKDAFFAGLPEEPANIKKQRSCPLMCA